MQKAISAWDEHFYNNNICEVYFIAHDCNISSSKIKYNDNYLFLKSQKVGKKMSSELWIASDNLVLKD